MQEIRQTIKKQTMSYMPFFSKLEIKNQPANIVQSQPVEFIIKPHYEIKDFNKFHGAEFIINAYLGILKRPPDESGLQHHLNSLENNSLAKIDILGALRFSKEGRLNKVLVLGLKKRLFLSKTFRIPVFGFLINTIFNIFNINSLVNKINELESHLDKESKKSSLLQQALNNKVDSEAISKLLDLLVAETQVNLTNLNEKLVSIIHESSRDTHLKLNGKVNHESLNKFNAKLDVFEKNIVNLEELTSFTYKLKDTLYDETQRNEHDLHVLKNNMLKILENKVNINELLNILEEVKGLKTELTKIERLQKNTLHINDFEDLKQTVTNKINKKANQKNFKSFKNKNNLTIQHFNKKLEEKILTEANHIYAIKRQLEIMAKELSSFNHIKETHEMQNTKIDLKVDRDEIVQLKRVLNTNIESRALRIELLKFMRTVKSNNKLEQ